ncbi:hypothetical protein JRQ81_000392 [Phrynocephalus forsythii]|uniref:Uncharacterized protein n=1 Tax=Phrynocephalus forsythii TaxID=171643 RepID=A0A9Q0Y6E8_9SAUR|nr:hypothetical protein JRQ81_000392 [Phrynocephalus forsythii]
MENAAAPSGSRPSPSGSLASATTSASAMPKNTAKAPNKSGSKGDKRKKQQKPSETAPKTRGSKSSGRSKSSPRRAEPPLAETATLNTRSADNDQPPSLARDPLPSPRSTHSITWGIASTDLPPILQVEGSRPSTPGSDLSGLSEAPQTLPNMQNAASAKAASRRRAYSESLPSDVSSHQPSRSRHRSPSDSGDSTDPPSARRSRAIRAQVRASHRESSSDPMSPRRGHTHPASATRQRQASPHTDPPRKKKAKTKHIEVDSSDIDSSTPRRRLARRKRTRRHELLYLHPDYLDYQGYRDYEDSYSSDPSPPRGRRRHRQRPRDLSPSPKRQRRARDFTDSETPPPRERQPRARPTKSHCAQAVPQAAQPSKKRGGLPQTTTRVQPNIQPEQLPSSAAAPTNSTAPRESRSRHHRDHPAAQLPAPPADPSMDIDPDDSEGLVCFSEMESYAAGSIATRSVSQARHVSVERRD